MPHNLDPAMLAKAETLTEALPYLQRYAGKTFVVKYGGHAMGDPELARDFAEDVVLQRLRVQPLARRLQVRSVYWSAARSGLLPARSVAAPLAR